MEQGKLRLKLRQVFYKIQHHCRPNSHFINLIDSRVWCIDASGIMVAITLLHLLFLNSIKPTVSSNRPESKLGQHMALIDRIALSKTIPNTIEDCTQIYYCGDTPNCNYNGIELQSLKSSSLLFDKAGNTSSIAFSTSFNKFSKPCSLVTYFDPNVSEISYEWVYSLPGCFYDTIHIFFLNSPPSLEEISVGFRVVFNQVLVLPEDEKKCADLLTLDMYGKRLISMGCLCQLESQLWKTLPGNLPFLHNKWIDFHGDPYILGIAGKVPFGPSDKDLDFVVSHRNMRIPLKEMASVTKLYFDLSTAIIEITESFNATPKLTRFPTAVNGIQKIPGTEELEGVGYELTKGTAHGSFGLSIALEPSKYVIFADVYTFDEYSFLTGLPTRTMGSYFFIIEAFEPIVWLAYGIITIILIGILTAINLSTATAFDVRFIYATIKPLFDQSLEPSVMDGILANYKARILIAMPLLTTIVASSLFKSDLTSQLVQPMYTYPPSTIEELSDSSYEIGTFLSQATALNEIIEALSNTTVVKKMIPRLNHHTVDKRDDCISNLVKRPVVCMTLRSLGSGAAKVVLPDDQYGFRKYVWSKDFLIAGYGALAMSRLMPHVKDTKSGVDGFEERNRLRSKSANNRAHRRKKRPTKNSKDESSKPRDPIREEDDLINKPDSPQQEVKESSANSKVSSKKKLHSSFVVRLPQKPKLHRDNSEKSQSFDYNPDTPEDQNELEEGPKVMTWFKGPGSHAKSRESGMGANGSVHVDGRLKSRSQSSSALYCIGKSSGSSLDHPGIPERPYHNNYNYLNCHPGNTTNGLSNSIPADLWNLPPTAKSFSPLTQIKHNANNQNNTSTTANTTTSGNTYSASNPKSVKHRAMPSVVDAIKGKKGSKGGKNRAKLYAVSCPDVAQHTQCANADHLHHQNQDYAYEEYPHPLARLGMIPTQGIIEDGGKSGKPSTGGYRNSNHPHYHHHQPNHTHHNQHNPNHHQPNPVISNHQLTQSHPHLYLNNSNPLQQQKQQLHKGNPPGHKEGYSSGGPISASYQHLPSYFIQQEHLNHHQSSSNITHHPSNQINQRGRSSLPNQENCDFNKLQDQSCSLFPIPAFVIPDNIFEVQLQRDQRGLGLSVTGGLDSQEKYPGLIRIKKVFPMSPASQSGGIRSWDIILQANGVPLTGLTNHEALEVLRTTPAETILTLCRPPPNVPGFLDTVDHSCSQNHNEIHSPPQQFADPPNSHFSYSHHHPSSHIFNSSSKVQQKQNPYPGQFDNDGYTSGPSMNSSAFNPTAKSKSLSSLKIPASQQPLLQNIYGEFEVTLEKVAGSLGFTLRQEDTSVLGHYVRALVKDPAVSDGRIKPGDRIISVNGHDLSEMSHADAINCLRQCPLQVTLRLYRDTSPTPISPLSPVESHKSIKAKPLRQEAIDMLNDLAIRKQMSGSGTDPKYSSSAVGRTGLRSHKVSPHDANCPATLPRRRHAAVTPSPEVLSAALSRFAGTSPAKPVKSTRGENSGSGASGGSGHGEENEQNYPTETRSSGSGESTPVGTIIQHKTKKTDPYKGYSDLRSDSIISKGTTRSNNEYDGDITSDVDELNEPDKKKTSFRQFTLHLDQISSFDEDGSFHSDLNHHDSIVSEPGGKRIGSNFRHGQPAYQSAILPSTTGKVRGKGGRLKDNFGSGFRMAGGDSPTALSDIDIPSTYSSATYTTPKDTQQNGRDNDKGTKSGKGCSSSSTAGSSSSASDSNNPGSLLKWKGIQFSKDDEEDTETTVSSENLDSNLRKPVGSSSGSEQGKKSKQYLDIGDEDKNQFLPKRRSPDGREFRECEMEISSTSQLNGDQIFTVQLSRRWCSRLGFSLQGSEGHTYISAIYPDSVAAKDGRLRVGDEIIMVNGETIRDMNTTEVIDIMRKTRGIISITLLRKPSSDPEINTSDSELGLR